jgi:hypothetical protein
LVCLLIAAGAVLWTVSFRLGSDRDDAEDARRSNANLPGHAGNWAGHPYPTPPADDESSSTIALTLCRVLDPSGEPLEGAVVRAGDIEVCADPNGRLALGSDARLIRITHDGFFALEIDSLQEHRRRLSGSPSDADDADDEDPSAHAEPPETVDFVLFPGTRLAGDVVGPTGAPIHGVHVTIGRDLMHPIASVRSDADGRWSSPLLHPGAVAVLFSHSDFRIHEKRVLLADPGVDARCDARLEVGQAMTVNVESQAGRPLADADVWIDLSKTGSASTRHYLGRTDDLGQLHCHRAAGRRGRVRARLAGYRETSASLSDVDRLGGREIFALSLADALHVCARAVHAVDGLPVTPKGIALESLVDGAFRAVPHRGLLFHSLSDGKIRAGLPPQPGTYRLVVHAAGGLFGFSNDIVVDGIQSPDPVVIRLEHTPHLSGHVLGDRRAVAGAVVELFAAIDDGRIQPRIHGVSVPTKPNVLFSTRTDASGRFSFVGVPVDSFRLAVRHANFAEHLTARIVLPLPDGSELPIQMTRGGVLRGQLLCADGAEPGRLPVVLTSLSCRPRSTLTDESGRFAFRGLSAADDYIVTAARAETGAYAHTMAPGSVGPLSLTAGGETRCELKTTRSAAGSLAGRVLLDGKGFACGVRIYSSQSSLSLVELRTDDDGRFFVRPLPPGGYRIAGVEIPFERTASVRAGERSDAKLDIKTLSWEVEIVSSETGARLVTPGSVRIAPASTRDLSVGRTVSLSAGRGKVEGLWPGVYTVHVEAPGFVSTDRRIDLSRSSASRVALEPGKAVGLRLVEKDGSVFRGNAEVTILRGDKTIHRQNRHVDETLSLPTLARGSYSVIVKIDRRELRYQLTID